MKLTFRKSKVSEIVQYIANVTDANFNEDYGEYSVDFPSNLGEGNVEGINFPNGVGLLMFRFTLQEDCTLEFVSEEIQPLKLLFCVEGECAHQFSHEKELHYLEANQSAILGAKSGSGHVFKIKANTAIHLKFVEIDRKVFSEQLTFPIEQMESLYYEMLADTKAIRTIYHFTQYSLQISRTLEEIDNYEQTGLQKTTFLGSRALSLFSYMLMLYSDDVQNVDEHQIPRKDEIIKIKKVILMIDEQLEHLPTIEELARIAGISEPKLQEGFKTLFDQTANKYIQSRRLELAMYLLKKGEKTISEIVYAVGLNSRSHFSKIFKEHYGVSPSKVKKA